MNHHDDHQRAEAKTRRAATDACHHCDDSGMIPGRQNIHGTTREVAWRCDHTGTQTMPTGFIPTRP